MTKQEVINKIKNFRGDDGWWKSDGEKEALKALDVLIEHNFSNSDAYELISKLILVGMEEYGG